MYTPFVTNHSTYTAVINPKSIHEYIGQTLRLAPTTARRSSYMASQDLATACQCAVEEVGGVSNLFVLDYLDTDV